MTRNDLKYLSYKEAWSRITKGLGNGSSLEVVTICESIIADRIWSYVSGVDPHSGVTHRTSFGDLIRAWKKLTEQAPPQFKDSSLVEQVDEWRGKRNEIVHGLVKSKPGTPTKPVDVFLREAQETAETGKKLAGAVQDWHRAQKRLSRQQRDERRLGR